MVGGGWKAEWVAGLVFYGFGWQTKAEGSSWITPLHEGGGGGVARERKVRVCGNSEYRLRHIHEYS